MSLALVLCSNKCDLMENRQVDIDEVQTYAYSIDASYIETSCRDDINVEKNFKYIGRKNVVRTYDDVTAMEEDLTTIDFSVNEQIKAQSWIAKC